MLLGHSESPSVDSGRLPVSGDLTFFFTVISSPIEAGFIVHLGKEVARTTSIPLDLAV